MDNVMINTIMQASTLRPQALMEGGRVSQSGVGAAGNSARQVASTMRSLGSEGNLGWLPIGVGKNVDLMA